MNEVIETQVPHPEATPPVIPLSGPITLIKESWKWYRTNFHRLVPVLLIAFLASSFQLILSLSGGRIPVMYMLGSILAIILMVLSYLALIIMVADPVSDTLSTSTAYQKATKIVWAYLWVAILNGIAIATGSAVFIIPGIAFGVFLAFSFYVLVSEGKQGMSALVQSWHYVQGNWWKVLGRMLVMVIAMALISGIISGIFTVIGLNHVGPLLPTHSRTGMHVDVGMADDLPGASRISLVYGILTQAVSSLVLTPLAMIFMYLLYVNLRNQKVTALDEAGSKKIRKTLYTFMIIGGVIAILLLITAIVAGGMALMYFFQQPEVLNSTMG